MTALVGTIVIGGDYQGLGIARSLGRLGIPIFVLDDEYSICRFSKYATDSARVSNLRDEGGVMETLVSLAKRKDLNGWVLFPTRDELVAAISKNKALLSQWFRVPTADWDTVRWIWDKRNTYRLAEKLAIPIPKTWRPRSVDALQDINGSFPVVVKPSIKEHFFYAFGQKAWRANNMQELRTLFERASKIAGHDEIVIQDLIPGDGAMQFAYCAFFKEHRAVGKMVVQRLRQHPHEFGRASTYAATVDLPEIETLAERFLRAISYYGLVEVEFKKDPRSGEFKLLDVNGRTWGYHSLGQAAGVDFPAMLYSDQLNHDLNDASTRPGVAWVRLLTDVPVAAADILSGRLKLSRYVESLLKADHDAVFSWTDPLPGICELALLPYLIYRRGF